MFRHVYAFTLIELLVVISIIAVLAGMLLGGMTVVRERSRQAQARQTIDQLFQSVEVYRAEEGRKRYPPVAADKVISHAAPGAAPAILDVLDERKLFTQSGSQIRDRILIDPWGNPFRYDTVRPAPAANAHRLTGLDATGTAVDAGGTPWNWKPDPNGDGDPSDGRELRWGNRWDGTAMTAGSLPFPYLWSLGKAGLPDDAGTWVYAAETP